MRWLAAVAMIACALAAGTTVAHAATASYKPQHVPPPELAQALGAREVEGRVGLSWTVGDRTHVVEVRRNDPANLLLFSGDDAAVAGAIELARSYDQPARQILLEARIVEVNTDRARDLGIDWSQLVLNVSGRSDASRRHDTAEQTYQSPSGSTTTRSTLDARFGQLSETSSLTLSNALKLLEANGASQSRDMPRVITLNNRAATIFDGQRVTFTTRANGYVNLYEADTMDAGLKLDITPSLLESGVLRLRLTAELTELAFVSDPLRSGTEYAAIGGSPVKRGQIVENTIMARAGEPIVLGGFTRNAQLKSRKRFPILGTVLPFLFSREIEQQTHHASLLTLTPRVVDLDAGPDEAQKRLLDGN